MILDLIFSNRFNFFLLEIKVFFASSCRFCLLPINSYCMCSWFFVAESFLTHSLKTIKFCMLFWCYFSGDYKPDPATIAPRQLQ